MADLTIRYRNRDCRLRIGSYANGSPLLELTSVSGELITVATIGDPRIVLPPGMVLIDLDRRDILTALSAGGVIGSMGKRVDLQYAHAQIVELLIYSQ